METIDAPKPTEQALNFFKDMKGGGVMPKPAIIEEEEKKEVITEEKKEDTEELELKRDKPPVKQVKATAEESIAVLRKQRDELAASNKIFTETFGEHSPKVIKPIFDLLVETSDGPVTEASVVEFLSNHKALSDEVASLKAELEEKEKKVVDIDIRYSEDFKNNFDIPYKEAAQSLFLEFANIQGDEVIAPSATKAFNDALLAKPDATAMEVKTWLTAFVKAYRDESGEEPIIPGLTTIMNSLREFRQKAVKLQDAYTNWSTKKKEVEQSKMVENQNQTASQQKALAVKRKELAAKAFREYDLDATPFLTEKDIEALIREEYKFGEDIREGKNVPEYDVFLKRGVDARLWEKHKAEFAELREFKEQAERGERNNLEGNDRFSKTKNGQPGENWLTKKF